MTVAKPDLVPTTSPQAKRLALLLGPQHKWKAPLVYALSYPGRFDIPQLETTLRLLSRRHSSLRTYFLPGTSIDEAGCVPAHEASWPLRVVVADGDDGESLSQGSLAWLRRDFDPFERPLVRALLLRRQDDDVLGLAVDHCLTDGYSTRILLQDLAHVYAGLRSRPVSEFDKLESDAVRFAHEERAWLRSDEAAAALEYWDRLNAGLGPYPRLELATRAPFDPDAPLIRHRVVASPDAAMGVRALAGELRVSVFILIAGAVAMSLREHVRSDDIAVLFANSRRTWRSTAKLVAYVANRSLLRVAVSRTGTIAAAVQQVRSSALEAVRHGMLCHEQFLRVRFPHAYERQPATAHITLNVMHRRAQPQIDGRPISMLSLPPRGHDYTTPGIGINVAVDPDGTLALEAHHSEGMYDQVLVEHLARRVVKCLTSTATRN